MSDLFNLSIPGGAPTFAFNDLLLWNQCGYVLVVFGVILQVELVLKHAVSGGCQWVITMSGDTGSMYVYVYYRCSGDSTLWALKLTPLFWDCPGYWQLSGC